MKFLLFFILLLATLDNAAAFTTKKREPTRTAFKALNKKEESPASGSTATVATASGNAAALAFAPYVAYDLSQEEDDEVVIGYGTAIISCALSLALGFGLGYGT